MTATPQELAHYLKCKGGEAGEGLLVMKNWSTFYRNATDGTWHHLAFFSKACPQELDRHKMRQVCFQHSTLVECT